MKFLLFIITILIITSCDFRKEKSIRTFSDTITNIEMTNSEELEIIQDSLENIKEKYFCSYDSSVIVGDFEITIRNPNSIKLLFKHYNIDKTNIEAKDYCKSIYLCNNDSSEFLIIDYFPDEPISNGPSDFSLATKESLQGIKFKTKINCIPDVKKFKTKKGVCLDMSYNNFIKFYGQEKLKISNVPEIEPHVSFSIKYNWCDSCKIWGNNPYISEEVYLFDKEHKLFGIDIGLSYP